MTITLLQALLIATVSSWGLAAETAQQPGVRLDVSRQLMAAMGGSELAWGTVMALWLAGMAAGSRVGARIGGPRAGSALPLASVWPV